MGIIDLCSYTYHMSFRTFLLAAPIALIVCLGGCNFNSYVYRTDVHQGNLITKEMLDQVTVGMARQQVHFLLGEPLIADDFHRNRWDYTYYLNPRYGKIQQRRVTLWFDENDLLVRVENPPLPTEKQADEMILGAEADYVPQPFPVDPGAQNNSWGSP